MKNKSSWTALTFLFGSFLIVSLILYFFDFNSDNQNKSILVNTTYNAEKRPMNYGPYQDDIFLGINEKVLTFNNIIYENYAVVELKPGDNTYYYHGSKRVRVFYLEGYEDAKEFVFAIDRLGNSFSINSNEDVTSLFNGRTKYQTTKQTKIGLATY